MLGRGAGSEGLPAVSTKDLLEKGVGDTRKTVLHLLIPQLAPVLSLMERLSLVSAPRSCCAQEVLRLWWECPELCSTHQLALLWGQPRMGCFAGPVRRGGRWA